MNTNMARSCTRRIGRRRIGSGQKKKPTHTQTYSSYAL